VETESDSPAEIDSLPIYPLPTAVLFPGIVIPLHVDEPCYCRLIADALEKDGVVAVAMIRPGEDGEAPPLCEIAGAGQIIGSQKLDGGDYNVLIQGLDRVRLLEELPQSCGYRRFRAEVIPKPDTNETDAARDELVRLESCVMNLMTSVAESDAQLVEVMRATPDLVQLADFLSATVVQDIDMQQELLAALDLRTRLKKLIDVLVDVLGRASTTLSKPTQLN
jgi:uncharacterized protein